MLPSVAQPCQHPDCGALQLLPASLCLRQPGPQLLRCQLTHFMVAKCGSEGALELAADTVKGQRRSAQLLQAQQVLLVRWLCADLAHVSERIRRSASAMMPDNVL